MTLKEKAKRLKTDIPAVYLAIKDRETPIAAKIMAVVTVAYALSPVDLIPDFIPILGYLDDVILLPVLIAVTVKLIPDDVMKRCREKAEGLWENGKPKKWYCALPVIIVWILIIFVFIRLIMSNHA